MYELMLEFFKENKEKKITGDSLKDLFNINHIGVQSLIHKMRVNREPILSHGNLGYSYSTDKEDIEKCYLSLMGRAISIIKSAEGLKNYLDERTDDV